MRRTTYKAYEISYHFMGDKWSGMVKPPNSALVLDGTVTATRAEGQDVYLTRVCAQIDADIAKTRAAPAKK